MSFRAYDYDYDRHHKDGCCGKKDKHDKMKHYKNCVEDVLEAILYAQNKVNKDECHTSCQQSIHELLGKKRVKKNTIPFLLYCGCEPFKGTGVTTYACHSKKEKIKCIHTHVFKIKELNKGCAVLELLDFKTDLKDRHPKHCPSKHGSACHQLDHKSLDDLVGTGICITVDLSCFCAITCLPAVHL
ncbi:spore coat protein [Halobacillus litoralis]|uniref:Spore coat protein n=1 Tax=Halobacillus litoralis TaxID=45668 RepID=A0A845FFP5_9BACI|nr:MULTISPECIES: CotY/CotZ family spore coat protein [Halobacillus]MEC3885576.1 CotY/CotZ family spore coat protein [Halobacillus sp. HZG1]MYL72436.1 spore coat protein [Halobacillus litoralis]